MKTNKALLACAVGCILMAPNLRAGTISIVNGNFATGAPATSWTTDATGTSTVAISGWTADPTPINSGDYSTTFLYTGGYAYQYGQFGNNGSETLTGAPAPGGAAAYTNGAILYQTLSSTVQPAYQYILTLNIGDNTTWNPDGEAYLMIGGSGDTGGTLYAATCTPSASSLTSGWTQCTATYTYNPADLGDSITILLEDSFAGSGIQGDFANLNLVSTPEPDSLVLLGTGFGLMGLALFLRKRYVHAASQMRQPTIV